MKRSLSAIGALALLSSVGATLMPTSAIAQTAQPAMEADHWQFTSAIDGYLPSIGSTTSFPAGGSSIINVDASSILNKPGRNG